MDLDEVIKYIIWIFFFSLAATALYVGLKKLGIV